MSEIRLHIDGTEVAAKEGMTVLQAAKQAGIYIPTLCHHETMEPYGGCRICTVEVESKGRTSLVAACLYPVEKDLTVRTRTEKVDKIRKVLVEFLLCHAPGSPQLEELAKEYGTDETRFRREPSFCLLCGLCVRYCAEIKKKNAVGFVENGGKRVISFVPEIATKECWKCKECFPLCPTSYLQAAYMLTEGLSFAPHSEQGEQ